MEDPFATLRIILSEYQKIDHLPVTKEEIDEIYITFREEGKYVK